MRFRNALGLRVSRKPSVDILCRRIGRSVALSSSRTTRVRAGIPAERGPRCRTSVSGLAPTTDEREALSRPPAQNQGRVGGRDTERSITTQGLRDASRGVVSGTLDHPFGVSQPMFAAPERKDRESWTGMSGFMGRRAAGDGYCRVKRRSMPRPSLRSCSPPVGGSRAALRRLRGFFLSGRRMSRAPERQKVARQC